MVVETSPERRDLLAQLDGFSISPRLQLQGGDFVILAIPPQVFGDFAKSVRGQFAPGTPVLSVMAGLTAASIAEALGTEQVVRSIPNTPSEVFEGMSVYYADAAVTDETIAKAEALLGSIGELLRVDAETLVDDATAICGGGPAFASYIMDAFCQFAASRGFTEAAGRQMAAQVFGGTATLISRSAKPPMQLCREVMTPNGTTERGIAAFDAARLKESVFTALTASAERSRELPSAMNAGQNSGELDG
jgi:pyrroline-5-carboxylate reductase